MTTMDNKPYHQFLFTVKIKEKESNKILYSNFFSSSVPGKTAEITDNDVVEAFLLEKGPANKFKIPILTSPMFWTVDLKDRNYVHHVLINKDFVDKCLKDSPMVRHYVILCAMDVTENYYTEAFNEANKTNIGHGVSVDIENYEILERTQPFPTGEIVKVSVVEMSNKQEPKLEPQAPIHDGDSTQVYNLYYRPKLSVLTLQVMVDKVPESFSFSKDAVQLKVDGLKILDLRIPLIIDISKPAKYKYDPKSQVFRLVFDVLEH